MRAGRAVRERESLIQVIVEFVVEVVLDGAYQGAARVLRSYFGRMALTAVLGLAFGLVWGAGPAKRRPKPCSDNHFARLNAPGLHGAVEMA